MKLALNVLRGDALAVEGGAESVEGAVRVRLRLTHQLLKGFAHRWRERLASVGVVQKFDVPDDVGSIVHAPIIPQHLPDCKFISFNDFAAEHDLEPPDDVEWGDRAGFQHCHPDCPDLAPALALGRELAERFGW